MTICIRRFKAHEKSEKRNESAPAICLGTYPFLLYVNDMQKVIKNSPVVTIADHTTVKGSVKQIVILGSHDLWIVTKYFSFCNLNINDGKCETKSIGPHMLDNKIFSEHASIQVFCKFWIHIWTSDSKLAY